MENQVVVKITEITSVDDNGGFTRNPFEVGQLVIKNIDKKMNVGDFYSGGEMTQSSGSFGYGLVNYNGVVVYVE